MQKSELQSLIEKAQRLGDYTKCDGLANGYDQYEHNAELESLLSYLGPVFPVAILEQASRIMREKAQKIKNAIKDELYSQGLGDEVTLRDGSVLQVKTRYDAKIVNKPAFLDWLDGLGYGSKIKTTYSFIKGQDVSELDGFLADHGVSFDKDTSIHHRSLDTVLKEIMEREGNDFAPDGSVATIVQDDYVVIKKNKGGR